LINDGEDSKLLSMTTESLYYDKRPFWATSYNENTLHRVLSKQGNEEGTMEEILLRNAESEIPPNWTFNDTEIPTSRKLRLL
jgi:hypothetical protein